MKIASNEYRYSDGDVPLTGFLVRPDDVPEQPAPAVLLVHGGGGLDEHARTQAKRYAALGYIVLACDMFGAGVAGDRGRIVAALTAMRDDPDLLLQRVTSGLEALRTVPDVADSCAAPSPVVTQLPAAAVTRTPLSARESRLPTRRRT